MPFSLRLDPETEAILRRLSAATRRSKSLVVREAVAHYASERRVTAPGGSAFDRLRPFIGVISTGGANYSQNTHVKYRDRLRQKRRARRPR